MHAPFRVRTIPPDYLGDVADSSLRWGAAAAQVRYFRKAIPAESPGWDCVSIPIPCYFIFDVVHRRIDLCLFRASNPRNLAMSMRLRGRSASRPCGKALSVSWILDAICYGSSGSSCSSSSNGNVRPYPLSIYPYLVEQPGL